METAQKHALATTGRAVPCWTQEGPVCTDRSETDLARIPFGERSGQHEWTLYGVRPGPGIGCQGQKLKLSGLGAESQPAALETAPGLGC
jgi:hypothetical protein